MKKKILLICFITALISNFSYSQVLQSQNFNELSLGDVGTDITGVTPGQGDLLTFTDSGENSDFLIVDSTLSLENVLLLNGPTGDTGSRFVWMNGLNTSWLNRTSGNNIIEIECYFFTGPATSSDVITGIQLYDSSFNTIAGFRFVPSTKVITGLAYFDPGGGGTVGTYFFDLGSGGTEIVLSENTWYQIGFAFNITTGEVVWRGPGFYAGITGALAGTNPFEVDFVLIPNSTNTSATITGFDDLVITAVDTENLLGITSNELSKSVKIYPNPISDAINFQTPNNIDITRIEVTDINGKIIKSVQKEFISNSLNLSDLNSGLYFLNIYSNDGKASKRFIKK